MKMMGQVNRFYALCGDERIGGKLKAEQEKLRGLLSPDGPAGELENALEPYVQYVRAFDVINKRAKGNARIGYRVSFSVTSWWMRWQNTGYRSGRTRLWSRRRKKWLWEREAL